MELKRVDFFSPWIVALVIILFLIMGYIGSFNYRFEDPLNSSVIAIVLYSVAIFLIASLIVKYKIKVEEIPMKQVLTEKIILTVVIVAILLQCLNLVLLGGIPLFNSVLKSNATTMLWRVSYLLFLPFMNLLLARNYKKRYLILVLIGALIYGLNGYRTSVLGVLGSSFITLYYIKKINRKIGIIFLALIFIGAIAIGYIASQSIANQHWMLNPLELVFYRFGFTLEVFEKIIPLAGTTHGHILSMIFSSGSPRTFIGNYVLHYNVCLTSTLFGPVMLDFGLIGLTIQMLFLGAFLKIMNKLAKSLKGIGIALYSIILVHTLIWIETGPTDIMIWIFFLLGILLTIVAIKDKALSFK
ncbi:MAG: oligosaccharide repeat unit polymerase family protein [Methanobrevibacter sp.]|uniref:oligosaccharide repeat unit polymerase family protein n=1 Tax=Methanobrevibacter sp. TaxID=66852 RepID=UPI0026E03138|nr:oligosaccharide repeat unit polymerase family protein [Methanobrevibacter sp.]MDO5847933.1 oligosaccharide repeat unit polymerase family protein [Methanobrevibacter sp.]